jgi:hypothetical protein
MIKMRLYGHIVRRVLTLAILCLVLCVFSGCAIVGPRSISMGRAGYNEVINKTEDEQMLLSMVKSRYGETASLLAVSGVAANVRFSTRAGVQAGFGSDESYAGNLVPFSGGLVYEENPTITYVPVQGEQYLRQLMSPIPLDILILFMLNETYSSNPLALLAKRINDMQNPDFLDPPSMKPDPRFQRFVELSKELDQAGVIQMVTDPRKEAPFDLLVTGYAPTYSERVKEYLALLGLSMPADAFSDIVFPVVFGVKGRQFDGIAISTRSILDLIEILKAAIEVPQEHVDAGLAVTYPAMSLTGKNIHIHASKDKPKQAALAVKHRGYWFYIDDTDMHTKLYYRTVRTLWLTGIAGATDHRAAPVLTIPVSG